jgi:hypothetical protein
MALQLGSQSIDRSVTIMTTLLVTGIVGVIGCASPTIRALRIKPGEALRES